MEMPNDFEFLINIGKIAPQFPAFNSKDVFHNPRGYVDYGW